MILDRQVEESAIDMSPEAVDARLRELSELWEFWMRLEQDRRDGKLSGPGVRTEPELQSSSTAADELGEPDGEAAR